VEEEDRFVAAVVRRAESGADEGVVIPLNLGSRDNQGYFSDCLRGLL
jgi:hypothetical protein